MTLKRILAYLSPLALAPVVFYSTMDSPLLESSKCKASGNFTISSQGVATTPDNGDIVIENIPTTIGSKYYFSVDLLEGGWTSSVQLYNGDSTIYCINSPPVGTITHSFIATTKTLQISLSYGPSKWANVTLDEIVE